MNVLLPLLSGFSPLEQVRLAVNGRARKECLPFINHASKPNLVAFLLVCAEQSVIENVRYGLGLQGTLRL